MKKEIKKIDDDQYEISFDGNGKLIYNKKSKIKKGKLSRASGARFELKVRENLEKEGWIIDKWTNNVNLKDGKLVKCKPKFNPFTKSLMMNTAGFPDFIAIKMKKGDLYEVIGIEVKRNGYLDKEEKEKCKFYVEHKIFSKILVARAKKYGRIIEIDYKEIKENLYN